MYSYPLTTSSSLKYQVNASEGTLSMERIHNEELCLGLVFNETGGMVSSEAVV